MADRPTLNRYRLLNYAGHLRQPRAGLLVDEYVIDVAYGLATFPIAPLADESTLGVLRRWRELAPMLGDLAWAARAGRLSCTASLLADVQLLAPVLQPGAIFCAGANYRDHVAEMSRALNLPPEPDPHALGLTPWHFLKASTAVRGPNTAVPLPRYSQQVDWEAEIAIVMGCECKDVGVEDALNYVAGLTIVNDLSARDFLTRRGVAATSPFYYDWVSQKSFDGALPMGPWICPLDQVHDPHQLSIKLWINDELMQDSSSANLIFTMQEQIAHLSTRLTLMPGDVIATGTPAGVGAARGRFLKSGDTARIEVEGIGELLTHFV